MKNIEEKKDELMTQLEQVLSKLKLDVEFEIDSINLKPKSNEAKEMSRGTICKWVTGPDGKRYISCSKG